SGGHDRNSHHGFYGYSRIQPAQSASIRVIRGQSPGDWPSFVLESKYRPQPRWPTEHTEQGRGSPLWSAPLRGALDRVVGGCAFPPSAPPTSACFRVFGVFSGQPRTRSIFGEDWQKD